MISPQGHDIPKTEMSEESLKNAELPGNSEMIVNHSDANAHTDFEVVSDDDYDDEAADRHNEDLGNLRYRLIRSTNWVRAVLILMSIGFTFVLGVALWLNPYDEQGNPRKMETHRQLGLPQCSFVTMTGKPCPSCGMTTSFALLAHGDIVNSLKANWVGTFLAAYWFSLIPWGIYSAIKGRAQFVRNGEFLITVSLIFFVVLMLIRWTYVLLLK